MVWVWCVSGIITFLILTVSHWLAYRLGARNEEVKLAKFYKELPTGWPTGLKKEDWLPK